MIVFRHRCMFFLMPPYTCGGSGNLDSRTVVMHPLKHTSRNIGKTSKGLDKQNLRVRLPFSRKAGALRTTHHRKKRNGMVLSGNGILLPSTSDGPSPTVKFSRGSYWILGLSSGMTISRTFQKLVGFPPTTECPHRDGSCRCPGSRRLSSSMTRHAFQLRSNPNELVFLGRSASFCLQQRRLR